MSKKKRTRESVNAFVDVLRKDEITMKTFTMDLFLLEQLKELEGEEKTGVRLVDAEESDGKDETTTHIEGLNLGEA